MTKRFKATCALVGAAVGGVIGYVYHPGKPDGIAIGALLGAVLVNFILEMV